MKIEMTLLSKQIYFDLILNSYHQWNLLINFNENCLQSNTNINSPLGFYRDPKLTKSLRCDIVLWL
jgi:hypothetical protein